MNEKSGENLGEQTGGLAAQTSANQKQSGSEETAAFAQIIGVKAADSGVVNENAGQGNGAATLPVRARHRSRGSGAGVKTALKERRIPFWLDALGVMFTAVVISALIKAFLMQGFIIPSPSMDNTLQKGDQIFVSKLNPAIKSLERGDIVVFEDKGNWLPPEYKTPAPTGFEATSLGRGMDSVLKLIGVRPESAEGYLVKRLIGLPGDRVQCCDISGRLIVNGVALEEEYLPEPAAPLLFDVTVPRGKIWVEGDNRNNSGDSRYHMDSPQGGFIAIKDVVGRAFVRYLPLSRIGFLPQTNAFCKVPPAGEAPVGMPPASALPVPETP